MRFYIWQKSFRSIFDPITSWTFLDTESLLVFFSHFYCKRLTCFLQLKNLLKDVLLILYVLVCHFLIISGPISSNLGQQMLITWRNNITCQNVLKQATWISYKTVCSNIGIQRYWSLNNMHAAGQCHFRSISLPKLIVHATIELSNGSAAGERG